MPDVPAGEHKPVKDGHAVGVAGLQGHLQALGLQRGAEQRAGGQRLRPDMQIAERGHHAPGRPGIARVVVREVNHRGAAVSTATEDGAARGNTPPAYRSITGMAARRLGVRV
jgi:hypothetical protein